MYHASRLRVGSRATVDEARLRRSGREEDARVRGDLKGKRSATAGQATGGVKSWKATPKPKSKGRALIFA